MRRSHFTIALLLSFLATLGGLQWWQRVEYPIAVWLILGFLVFFALLVLLFHMYSCTGTRVHVLGGILLCVAVGSSFALLRVARTTHVTTPTDIEAFANGQEVMVRGRIVDAPDRRPMKTRYTVEVSSLALRDAPLRGAPPAFAEASAGRQGDTNIPVKGKILATDYALWPRHEYGDEVMIKGVLEHPEPFDDFAYDRYLSRYGIYAIISRAEVQMLSSGHDSALLGTLIKLRERFEAQINRIMPEPHASFLAGLLTGSRRGLPEHVLEDFRATGLTHIIAVSGANVAIVLEVIAAMLFFLPLRFRFLPSLLALAAFTLFVGASPSVVRAAIMGGLGLLALHSGRERHTLIAILVAGSLMAGWNPKLLWYDAGFQLSFLSVLGLSFFNPFLEKPSKLIPDILGMREAFRMTIAAQIMAVPFVAFLFGEFSLIAPLANILIAPFVPIAMLLGAVAVFASFLFLPLGFFLGYPTYGALEAILSVAHVLGNQSFALFKVYSISVWWMGAYYLLLLLILYHLYTKIRGPSLP
ncbi:MAG: ComEC/Rec2 family competence protein [Patescibacteria group bacterium]